MRKLHLFEIVYDHSDAVYKAGDMVRGQVFVKLSEPMKMRNIRLWCQGKGKVHWTKTKHSARHTRTIDYRSEEVYFDTTEIIAGSAHGEFVLPEGEHKLDFAIPLAPSLPSSFEGWHGYVRYMSKATVDKPWKFDHETKTAFTVVSRLDLNEEPMELKTPMQGRDTSQVSCCCCYSGTVTADFRINRRGFVPGECVIINAEVCNNSNSMVESTRVSIKQYTQFFASSDSLFASGKKERTQSLYVATKQRPAIKPGDSDRWVNVPLQVPALPPSRLVGCNIINISYVVKFYASVSYGEELKLACNIIIGSVPLRETIAEFVPPPGACALAATGVNAEATQHFDMLIPPPSYQECYNGKVHIRDDHDTQYTRGDMQWAPKYPFYQQLSVETN